MYSRSRTYSRSTGRCIAADTTERVFNAFPSNSRTGEYAIGVRYAEAPGDGDGEMFYVNATDAAVLARFFGAIAVELEAC
jgi:hypothetical protein